MSEAPYDPAPVEPQYYPPPPEPAVTARGLGKRFGAKVAVGGVDIDVMRGSFTGLVGPNGAGKTTTLRMLTGLLRPDHGQAWVAQREVWPDPTSVKADIGVLPEDLRLFDRLSGRQLLEYHGLIREMPKPTIEQRSEELLHIFGLDESADEMIVDYSHGMTKKIGLAAALLHRPSVLFLDEPFEAIDPVSVRTIREVLQRFCESGSTIVFSSHVMDTVERLCDRVIVISGGYVVAAGPLAHVCAGRRLEDVFADLVGAQGPLDQGSLSWFES